jgi:hypothetical protein
MKNITQSNVTDAVKSSFERIDDARMRLLVNRLVHHLHAYAQDTQLTHAEWREGIAVLHRAASITTPSRSEFTLIRDLNWSPPAPSPTWCPPMARSVSCCARRTAMPGGLPTFT